MKGKANKMTHSDVGISKQLLHKKYHITGSSSSDYIVKAGRVKAFDVLYLVTGTFSDQTHGKIIANVGIDRNLGFSGG